MAKLCGVKCEKFYLGFDIGGLKLCKFRWGETEYGIGILPLGGYVKMLGQEDNPGQAADERERATMHVPARRRCRPKPVAGPHGEPTPFDPRSYLAKSVPQRMAIISAGVIMNVIFAFVMAVAGLPDRREATWPAASRPCCPARPPGRPTFSRATRSSASTTRAIARCDFAT